MQNGRMNKIILRKMPPLRTTPVTLLKVKAQVQTCWVIQESCWKKYETVKLHWVILYWNPISPEDNEQGEEWGDEQDYSDEDVPSEDEADDIAQDENSGRNIDWKSYQVKSKKTEEEKQTVIEWFSIRWNNQTIAIARIIVSITKFSIMIGSLHAYIFAG